MSGSDELFTGESFVYTCKQVGLTASEMDEMNIGQCLDYIQEWVDNNNKENSDKQATKANQGDFDSF